MSWAKGEKKLKKKTKPQRKREKIDPSLSLWDGMVVNNISGGPLSIEITVPEELNEMIFKKTGFCQISLPGRKGD